MMVPTDLRFLIVDDFATMRRIMRSLLRELGHVNVVEAQDGAVALGELQLGTFDFVVCDINMPVMSGFELLAAIKSDAHLKHLPVLMVTGEAHKEEILRAAKEGAAGYIVKPFAKRTLDEKIRKIWQNLDAPA